MSGGFQTFNNLAVIQSDTKARVVIMDVGCWGEMEKSVLENGF